jgi:hypothetical protein
MLTVFSNRPRIFNPILSEYCLQTSKDYIRKLVEKKSEERILNPKIIFKHDIDIPDNNNNNNNIIPFVCFLSITSLLIFFYNIKR